MNRRRFLSCGVSLMVASPLLGAFRQERFADAAGILEEWTGDQRVSAAVLHVERRGETFARHFGAAASTDAMFLLGSISKPIAAAPLMKLVDSGRVSLDDAAQRHLPEFTGEGRERVTVRQLLTHTSGLPDQLANNAELRQRHAPLEDFIKGALHTPVEFAPGSRYQYSSMGILLATHIAEKLSGTGIRELVQQQVFAPLGMKRSAQGLGRFKLSEMVPVQTEHGAPESGAGDPAAREWDWNSDYWRRLGAPWGGTHASAGDVAKFLDEFLFARGRLVRPETARLMTQNHNPEGIAPRGLAFNVGSGAGSEGCSERTFGHTGSTGTLAWADPESETICVVLTSLPGRAATPHPRELAGRRIAAVAKAE
jgi:CubicO group peptidase (beta-lactamase class C family)